VTSPMGWPGRAALREAAEWHVLSLLLARPTAAWREALSAVAGEVEDEAIRAAALEALDEATEGDYLAFLGPGGAISPREVGYREAADPGRLLAELRACYEAFAWRARLEEAPDHVAVECAFVAYLKLKEAAALVEQDVEAAEVTRAATSAVVETHLATIAETLVAQLRDQDAGYLVSAAEALLGRTGPRPKQTEGGWVPEGLDGCAFDCAALGQS